MMSFASFLRCVATLAVLAAARHGLAAEPLPMLNVDLAQTTVSGLSSGAYMAGQFHVAYSAQVIGAGIVAGGPYGCAEGRLEVALERCMATGLGEPDPAALFAAAAKLVATGAIDPLTNLADDRVYVFSGTETTPCCRRSPPRSRRSTPWPVYRATALRVEAAVPAGHGFATEDGPVACGTTAPPFVNDCDLDQAREILAFLHGPLQPAAATVPAPVAFDQSRYLSRPIGAGHGRDRVGLRAGGLPRRRGLPRPHRLPRLQAERRHGGGDAVTVGAGYNRWAETNRTVVLYPQAHATWSNPNGCWDWWGYTGTAYATKAGAQMAAVHRMLLALAGQADGGEACVRHEDWNLTHWQEGRAIPCGLGVCAAGSGDILGTFFGASTVFENPAGFFTAEQCAS